MTDIKRYKIPRYSTFRDLLTASGKVYDGRDMFREKDGNGVANTTVAQFEALVNALGASLLERGLLGGGKVAIIGENSVKWMAAYFAVVCGGGVTVPIDKELPAEEIANIIRDSGAKAVVYSPTFAEIMQQIAPGLPEVQAFIGMGRQEEGGKFLRFDALAGQGGVSPEKDRYCSIQTKTDEMCALLYTSGTTGKSKGVMLTQKNILDCAGGILELIEHGQVSLSVLPIHHSYEFSVDIVSSIMDGATICFNDSLRYFMQNLQLFRPEYMYVVPAFAEMIYAKIWANAKAQGREESLRALIKKSNAEREQGIDNRAVYFKDIKDALGGNLELIISGGAPLAAFYSKAFRDMGILLLQGYGITECSPLVSVNPDWGNVDGSIGLPISCCDVKIEDKDDEGNGEIWVRGTNVMLGYYNNPAATAEVMDGEWFNTGDIGYIDDDGYIFITGRKKNLIVLSNGKNVYPEEIEDYLKRIPYIKEVVVYAPAKDGVGEDRLVAEIFVDEAYTARHSADEIFRSLEADIAGVNKTLPVFKQVHDFHIRDKEFEKTTKKSIKRFTVHQS